ncbi:MAG: beta-phosphoglucomutase [Saprospiraceae bacterium]|nr:MAG: beta-phosphoglucomutase [Saprospiraceae bacterium]
MIKGCIFDLDGVIVDTAQHHFQAWRRLARELGTDLTETQNERLKGVSRIESLELILQWGGIELSEAEIKQQTIRKNEWYVDQIKHMDKHEILDGVLPFMESVKAAGCMIALGSASKNAGMVLDILDIRKYFTSIIDGNKTTRSKPDPQVFEMAAAEMGLKPEECIVFEDAEKGIEAAIKGGFKAVGIGKKEVLTEADLVIPNFIGRDLNSILADLNN